jgi:hypothetical protein
MPKVYAQVIVFYAICTVAYLLKARIVEPEKQPLLASGSETTFVSSQRLGKHVPAATNTYKAIEVLLETVFSTRSCKGVITKSIGVKQIRFVQESVKQRGSWKGAAVQRGLERVKLKNIHC